MYLLKTKAKIKKKINTKEYPWNINKRIIKISSVYQQHIRIYAVWTKFFLFFYIK
jgi:hypothetical protein